MGSEMCIRDRWYKEHVGTVVAGTAVCTNHATVALRVWFFRDNIHTKTKNVSTAFLIADTAILLLLQMLHCCRC